MAALSVDTSLFAAYAEARRQFLRALGCDESCRDPLSEFAECLVCQQLDGKLADSRVQKGYDLTTPDGRRVQVKYLANPPGGWRNEHVISFTGGTDDYVLVFFESFDVLGIVVFPKETVAQVCVALKKRHPHQDSTLQLTRANLNSLIERVDEFEEFGIRCYLPTERVVEKGAAPGDINTRELEGTP